MTSETARPKIPLGRVLALGGLSTFGPLSLDLYLPALPRLTADLGTTEALGQASMSVCMIGLAVGQLLVGPFSDRIGRRRPLLVGVALYAVTSLLCAFAPTIEALLVLRLIGGLAGAVGLVVSRAMVRDLYSGDAAARAFALLMVVGGMAPVIAPVLGSQLLRITDWRGLFVALALIGAVLLLAALTQRETLPLARRRAGGFADTSRALAGVLRDRTFLVPTLILALVCCGMFVYIAMGSYVLQGAPYALGAQAYGIVFAVNAVGIALASRLSAALVRRIGAADARRGGRGVRDGRGVCGHEPLLEWLKRRSVALEPLRQRRSVSRPGAPGGDRPGPRPSSPGRPRAPAPERRSSSSRRARRGRRRSGRAPGPSGRRPAGGARTRSRRPSGARRWPARSRS
jgi:DHA1 family bicyclomycin/chloramphenicol resistance-like MFS transporter